MRSKRKRSKSCKNARRSKKKQTEVIEISSESGCSDVDSAHDKDETPWNNNKQHFPNTDSNRYGLAPIFLRAKNTSKSVSGCRRPHITEAGSFTCQEPDKLPISDLDVRSRDVQVSPVNNIFSKLHKKGSLKGQDFTSSDKEHFQPVQNNFHQYKAHGTSSVPEEDCTTATIFSPSHIVQDSPMSTPEKLPRTNRLSRTRRLKQKNEPENEKTKGTESDQQSSKKTTVVFQREPFSEDVLWTDKYRPRHSSEIIGNVAAVEKLHSWLMKWKCKSNVEDKEKRSKAQSNDSWDCGDFEDEVGSEDGTEEQLWNTVLISGPPGVGKTASVFACAVELGFKVFEVNCSSQRSGREVLAQLKEATQSHQVEISSKDPLKPAFFNSYNTVRSAHKSDTLPAVKKKASVSTSKKKRAQKQSSCKESAKLITLTSYFRTKAKADYLNRKTGASPSKNPTKCTDSAISKDHDGTTSKNMTKSLILFEEVDVIFEDDVGFLAAIKTFMRTTKRPVVLTTSDPLFRERFNSSLEEIIFQTPSMADVCSYLRLVCLAEKVQVDTDDVKTLFAVTRGDVRRCLLQLQLWTNGAAGHGSHKFNKQEFTDKGCSANMLGLQSVNKNNLLQLLQASSWTEQQMTEILLPMTESWRNGFPLLYSNLELLFNFNANKLGNVCSGPGGKTLFCDTKQMETPGQYSTSSAEAKSRLGRKKNILSPQMSCSPTRTSQKPQCATDKWETASSLTALSDFFDLVSFIDATVPEATLCNLQEFVWTGAKIQDGFLDEMKEEEDKNKEMTLDFGATLEALGFHRCWRQVSDTGEVHKFRRGETSNTKNLNFITQHLDPIIVSQRLDLSRRILSSRYFSLLHNKRAVCIDYLPTIRFICRTHRKWRKRRTEELFRCVKALRTQLRLAKETVQLLAREFS